MLTDRFTPLRASVVAVSINALYVLTSAVTDRPAIALGADEAPLTRAERSV